MARQLRAAAWKRAAETPLALLLLVLLLPVLALAALLVKLESPGPVFFRQTRVGRFGRPFRIWKFRTMIVGAEQMGDGLLVRARDSRITRVGAWLRRMSLDELPQLINIVLGEMSFVGPRPGLLYQAEQYDCWQARRLLLRPGITGWAQIHGRNELSWPERIRYDVWYVDHWTSWLDLGILWQTARIVLEGTGTYTDDLGKFEVRPSREDP